MTDLPAGVRAMAGRGLGWAAWVESLPAMARDILAEWQLRPDGPATGGYCSLVLPVRTSDRAAAVLKLTFPDEESEHEHLALRRWGGDGAVRLLRADPRRRALLLERLGADDLTRLTDVEACHVVAGLYRHLHVPALPQLWTLASLIGGWTTDLAALPRSAPIPHRLVEQALSLCTQLATDTASSARVIHGDLHYQNVLAGRRQPWLVIDPKPINGDPHYEIAPMLWNRIDEMSGDIRVGVRRRFYTLVDAAGFDEDRARAWVVVRMVLNAMWAVRDAGQASPGWLTTCIAVAKAVQD
ncbi:aminoglycoside resistance protein [Mycobacterium sp. CVI_P3]|uniref:Aminoglycoside resistance protein n=1 Tax=Mycobacterium pinniadriaticum TaxID=2994102 RepID=A0ABT3S8M1_9MYCO|nr:aminoglycoside phosphotransferase family protein [Mycobacterium pinniadriaticum]MCX2929429.1 aminoglycoside resistance protein [Mycobacterium pinniadriaticum]MCX2935853.1 aminoglycoside resistance protein [Mycobacterium pinniadriaticum]